MWVRLAVGFLASGLLLGHAGCAGKTTETDSKPSFYPKSAPSKGWCMAQYPEASGGLLQRQQCLNGVASGAASNLNAQQKSVIADCSAELLRLANSADKALITMPVYQAQKGILLRKCSTALRTAGAR